jgi:hypothetical protein
LGVTANVGGGVGAGQLVRNGARVIHPIASLDWDALMSEQTRIFIALSLTEVTQ